MASAPREPAIRVILLPRDTNEAGTIFGGIILSYIDLAAVVEASRLNPRRRYVTVAMKEVVFHQPVFVGDLVSFYTEILRVGRTSATVKVDVLARRRSHPAAEVKVTEAEVVYVAVDERRRPVPILPRGVRTVARRSGSSARGGAASRRAARAGRAPRRAQSQ